MKFKIKNRIFLSGMQSAETAVKIKELLTMDNPKFFEARKMGRYTGNIKKELKFYEKRPGGLICPRGAATKIYNICKACGEDITILDNRRTLSPVNFTFAGRLKPLQAPAVQSCLSHDFGLLSSPTGSGKTCMALYLIAARRQPALIVVHTKELLNQWIDRIGQFLGIPAEEIGVIGSGKFSIGEKITIATVQTLVKKADQVAPSIGYLILDECHRAPAMQYANTIKAFDSKYMTGLTATPWRRDKLSKVIFWHIGDVVGQIDKQDLLKQGDLCQAKVVWIDTEFNTLTDASEFYSAALSELTKDTARNNLIAETVRRAGGEGVSLILSDRRDHCNALHSALQKYHVESEVLTGATKQKDREQIVKNLQAGICRCLIATGQLIGEGFDLPGIETIFLATPVKFSGRLIQYIGRALRPSPGKENAVIYDFVDRLNPVFRASAKARAYTYRQQNLNNHAGT